LPPCAGTALLPELISKWLGPTRNAGFAIETVRDNDYRFVSEQALGATTTYGVTRLSLLARRP
jgi:hypothetical protein